MKMAVDRRRKRSSPISPLAPTMPRKPCPPHPTSLADRSADLPRELPRTSAAAAVRRAGIPKGASRNAPLGPGELEGPGRRPLEATMPRAGANRGHRGRSPLEATRPAPGRNGDEPGVHRGGKPQWIKKRGLGRRPRREGCPEGQDRGQGRGLSPNDGARRGRKDAGWRAPANQPRKPACAARHRRAIA